MTKQAKRLVAKLKKPNFWQSLNLKAKYTGRDRKSQIAKQSPRETRAHEHPKEPERNKK
jgi:hypothetical protein